MQINITGHGVEITPSLRSYTIEKLERLKKRGSGITNVNVVFDVSKSQQTAKTTLHMSGIDIHAHSESEDLYCAIDLMIDKLNHQITKHKEKLKDHHRDEHHREEQYSEKDDLPSL